MVVVVVVVVVVAVAVAVAAAVVAMQQRVLRQEYLFFANVLLADFVPQLFTTLPICRWNANMFYQVFDIIRCIRINSRGRGDCSSGCNLTIF